MADFEHMQQEWKKSSSDDKFPIILGIIIFLSVFFPWMSTPEVTMGGMSMNIGVNINGMHSVGMLTFLGSLAYLAWKLLPMAGIKVPEMTDAASMNKILGIVMLAGPVLWLLRGGFNFEFIGWGMWVALIASAIFLYMAFSGKKMSQLRK